MGVNTITPGGTDFTISDTINGVAVQANISIAANSTIGDVLSNIKTAIDSARKPPEQSRPERHRLSAHNWRPRETASN